MEADIASEQDNMLDVFDNILFKHLERLIGSKYGVGELLMNSVAISLIILLMERENEIESFPSDEIDRYKNDTLLDDFEQLGFDAAMDMNIVVEEMILKGYIHMDDDRFIPQKPTISMARLIDLVFPKMPGMNLVAYFVQTMDEVTSKRKDLDSAVSQFDQVLQMQGVVLKKGQHQSDPSNVVVQPTFKDRNINGLDNYQPNRQKVSSEKDLKIPNILGRKSSDNLLDQSKGSSTVSNVLSSDAYQGKIEIKKVNFGQPSLKETEIKEKSSDKYKHIEDKKSKTPAAKFIETGLHNDIESISSDTKITTPSEEPVNAVIDEQIPNIDTVTAPVAIVGPDSSDENTSHDLKSAEQDQLVFSDIKDDSLKVGLFQKSMENDKETAENSPEVSHEKDVSSINDNDIEKRIMDFEEDLALECPLCKHSKVTVENTATGKSYYKCTNKECNFISWGRPYHMPCPKCNNPFLIEAYNKANKNILKCPRATCRYWNKTLSDTTNNYKKSNESASQKTSKVTSISRNPRRKVVRRRVVRRKK